MSQVKTIYPKFILNIVLKPPLHCSVKDITYFNKEQNWMRLKSTMTMPCLQSTLIPECRGLVRSNFHHQPCLLFYHNIAFQVKHWSSIIDINPLHLYMPWKVWLLSYQKKLFHENFMWYLNQHSRDYINGKVQIFIYNNICGEIKPLSKSPRGYASLMVSHSVH